MNDIIKKEEAIPLSDKQVMKLVNNKANLVLYPDLHKYDNIDDILGKYGACIILFESKPQYGHWCCIFKVTNKLLEFFNPYGGIYDGEPDEGLKYIDPKFREQTNQLIPYLSLLMINSPYELSYNEYKFQKMGKGINTCGRHVAVRLQNRKKSLNEYHEEMESVSKKYGIDFDAIVTLLTIKI
jgi:hypothetical protein